MATLEKRGYFEDFLLLEFAEDSKIYIPATGIDVIQKYIGGSGAIQNSAIGGTTAQP